MGPIHRYFARRRRDARSRIFTALDAAGGWSTGLDLMRACRMRAGRFYPALGRLEAEGLVEAKWDESEPEEKRRRRMYRLNEEPF